MGNAWLDTSALARILGFLAIVSGAVMSLAAPSAASAEFCDSAFQTTNGSASQDGWVHADAERVLATASAELASARRILHSEQLRGSLAFHSYLDALDAALPGHDTELTVAGAREMALGLVVARAAFEGAVSNATQWLSLFRSVHAGHVGPIAIPQRFVRRRVESPEPPMNFDAHAVAMRRAVSSFSGSRDADSSSSTTQFPSSAG
jgi:hypothetical protein